jgi:endonuclease G
MERDDFFERLIGGIEIRTKLLGKNNTIGTMGMIVYDLETKTPMGISNFHILKKGIKAAVYQPGVSRKTVRRTKSKYVAGRVKRLNARYDCGVFVVDLEKRKVNTENAFIGFKGMPKGVVDWEVGMKVKKSGKNSDVTYGIITEINPEDPESFRIGPNPDKPAKDGEISIGGDSGAIWVTDEDNFKIVGLHYAGEPNEKIHEYASAFPAKIVAEKLKISFLPI